MSSNSQPSGTPSNAIAKVAGGLFGLFVAPLIVTVGSSLLQKKIETEIVPKEAGKVAAGTPERSKKARPSASISTTLPVSEKKVTKLARRDVVEKKLPSPTIHLYNGADLSHFDTYLGIPYNGTKLYGKNSDPEKVFTVEYRDLHVSGKVTGILETEQDYENYQLTVEYRFGQKTWPPRERAPKISGVLLHAKPSPEATPAQWRLGYRVMLAEDSAGSIALPPADQTLSLTIEAEKAAAAPKAKAGRVRYRYQPGATPLTLTKGTIDRLGYTKGQASKDSGPEIKPQAGWNTLECLCVGDQLTVKLNGKVINAATKLSVTKGRIGIISEGAEIMFRTIDLKPVARSGIRGG